MPAYPGSGWRLEASFPLTIYSKDHPPCIFTIPFPHRDMVEVVQNLLSAHSETDQTVLEPHQLYWTPPRIPRTGPGIVRDETAFYQPPDQRLYSEIYNSDCLLRRYEAARSLNLACHLPPTVAAIASSSDATHPNNFGTVSLHPIYLTCGNFPATIWSRMTVKLLQLTAWFCKVRSTILLLLKNSYH